MTIKPLILTIMVFSRKKIISLNTYLLNKWQLEEKFLKLGLHFSTLYCVVFHLFQAANAKWQVTHFTKELQGFPF